jgi:hypothetical protein
VIRLIAGQGLAGDAHAGVRVQHLFRVRGDPSLPNLRQVHVIPGELPDELAAQGLTVAAGDLGENVTPAAWTCWVADRGSPVPRCAGRGAGDRPAHALRPARRVRERAAGRGARAGGDGTVIGKAAVMGIVIVGGQVRARDPIAVQLPDGPYRPPLPV